MGIPMGYTGKIVRLSALLFGVVLLGTLGYRFLLGWSWSDALYMTSITITTVGFGEVRPLAGGGRIFTILLLLTSGGVFAYSLTTLAAIVVELQFSDLIWRKRMDSKIEALRDHYIVCGYGRTGSTVCERLKAANIPFVVLEVSPAKLEELRHSEHLFIEADSTHDEFLHRAGIERAKGLVAALGNDAENVYLVLSARQFNPDLTIVAWASSAEAEQKVKRAGADHSISPYLQGGIRIVQLLTAPHALEFLDHAMGASDEMRLGEVHVRPGSRAIGNSISRMGISRDVGVIVIGIRRATGKMQFNPRADEVLLEGDVLIGIGSAQQIDKLQTFF
jgi:voltage-gated potassium channel